MEILSNSTAPTRQVSLFRPMKTALFLLLALLAVTLTASGASSARLRVSEDRRTLQYADGRPFLWLGDTAWELFHRLDREEAEHYLTHRARHGYSVIQAVVLAENDGLRTPNAYGDVPLIDLSPDQPNERYFAHVDHIVERANALGLFVGVLPTWGDKVPNAHPAAGPIIFNPDNAFRYGEFLGRRYRDRSVIWILGGDRDVDSLEVLEIWRAMARGLRQGDGGAHLITYHPRGESMSASFLHQEPWLDLNLFQSGHARRFNAVFRFAQRLGQFQPRKPFVDAEPAYEDIPVAFWEFLDWTRRPPVPPHVLDEDGLIRDRSHFQKGFFEAHDVRVHAYWNLLSGAAGYTYGNNAIWQMCRPGLPPAIPCLTDWRNALDRPGSRQMKWIRQLSDRFPPGTFGPDQSLIYGRNSEGADYVAAAVARDNSFALAYSPRGAAFDVVVDRLAGADVQVEWFDPREGTLTVLDGTPLQGIQRLTPPTQGDGQDWVLILTAR